MSRSYVELESPRADGLAHRRPDDVDIVDVLDRVLDRGIVIDASLRLSVVGVDLVSGLVRVVVVSRQADLRYPDVASRSLLRPPRTSRSRRPLPRRAS
ncbi:MAG: gas vesicle protein GvpJ [Candidatus Rokuibacteriota bacterium]